MLLLKLALVAASVWLSTLAARRFGHRVGGAVAGMPMIAAPIVAVLLVDHAPAQVRSIALATLVCMPATIAHIATFGLTAARFAWPACLALALSVYVVAAAVLTHLPIPPVLACLLAVAAPACGLWFAAHRAGAATPVAVPRIEFVLRIAAALAMAASIILGADVLPPAVSGLLLAVPITGTVLPCFTLPRYGAAATQALMAGFLQGLHGFAAFFVVLYWALGEMSAPLAFGLGLGAALLAAVGVQAAVRLARRRQAELPPAR